MQSYEDSVLVVLVGSFTDDGWQVGSLQFDGLLIDKFNPSKQYSIDESSARAVRAVKKNTGIDITLKQKEMEDKRDIYQMWDTNYLEPLPGDDAEDDCV